ncbi:MAG TPA: hypothetical protein VLF69_01920 [Candidatus Saccharimonadales bacterium]|nr:hypothetical protein [Candidatus Saccharimonadales bacterium]
MTAPNHALTGAVIGLSVANPWLALPLAFLSHFACDAIPHYDPPGNDKVKRIGSREFLRDFLVIGAVLCFLLVLCLTLARPEHWLQAAICAFLAASPDLFWIPRFLHIRRTGKDKPLRSWFLRFHVFIQWKTGPRLIWLELAWAAVFTGLVAVHL